MREETFENWKKPVSAPLNSTIKLTYKWSLSWFYDFRLLVFHIIKSCSILGIKCSSYGYLSGGEELRSPEDCSSTVIIPAQGNRYKACRSPDLGPLPSSRLVVLAFRLSCCCTQGFSISVRPLALGQSFSQLYLILLTIILNYIVL